LAAAFPAGTSFTLTDINNQMQISGYATSPDFRTSTAFIATVPEPGGVVLVLATAVSAVTARRQRRR
jgi:hypothetical protein